MHWQAPDLTRAVALVERRFRNQVMPVTRFREWDFYHVDPRISDKYVGGATDCQLAYSYNGWHFQRTLRDPLFPNPESAPPAPVRCARSRCWSTIGRSGSTPVPPAWNTATSLFHG